ncbi:MAG: hypothetical protein V4484_17040 [Pseudomonadota bacterium]
MAYVFILLAFVLWLLFAAAAMLTTRLTPRLATVYPYAWRVSLWGTVGFLVANAMLLGLLALGFMAMDTRHPAPSLTQDAAKIAWALAALGGPFIASALGWMAGCPFGVLLAFLRARRSLPDNGPP